MNIFLRTSLSNTRIIFYNLWKHVKAIIKEDPIVTMAVDEQGLRVWMRQYQGLSLVRFIIFNFSGELMECSIYVNKMRYKKITCAQTKAFFPLLLVYKGRLFHFVWVYCSFILNIEQVVVTKPIHIHGFASRKQRWDFHRIQPKGL